MALQPVIVVGANHVVLFLETDALGVVIGWRVENTTSAPIRLRISSLLGTVAETIVPGASSGALSLNVADSSYELTA